VPDFAPILGIQLEFGKWFEPLDGLVLAAMWRGAVGLPIDVEVDVAGSLSLEDIGDLEPYVIAGVLKGELLLYDHYVPSTVALGLAYRRNEAWSTYVDLRWTDWRGMLVNVAQLTSAEITSPLIDLNDALVDGNDFELVLRSVWSVRLGAEVRVGRWELNNRFRYLHFAMRGGFGHDPTPLKSQGASSAFLDTHRTMFTIGAGVETFDPFELLNGPVRLDAFFQVHRLSPYRLEHAADTPTPGYPVREGGFPIGGHIFVTGVQWSFDYQ